MESFDGNKNLIISYKKNRYYAIIVQLVTGMYRVMEDNREIADGQFSVPMRKVANNLYDQIWRENSITLKDPVYMLFVSDGRYDHTVKLNKLPSQLMDVWKILGIKNDYY
jgi:hypothetical protein